MNEPSIRVRSLTKSIAGRKVVDDLSFDVQKGQVFALLGHNGAGKSTTIDLILGLKAPDGGSARILGMDAAKNRKQVFERVGVQLQHTQYQSSITVEEACMEYASLYTDPADYPRLLDGFGLGALRKSFVSKLSGGERQKLSVVLPPHAGRNRTLHNLENSVICGWLKCAQLSITIIIQINNSEANMSIVEIRDLCKDYPAFQLKDVSFDIKKGVITGFIGRNGAGKTTTIKSMLNLVHPDSGEILFFGESLRGHETRAKQRIGYSTGTVNWYPRKKLGQIVGVVKRFYDTWDENAYRKYLEAFGLDENKTPLEMSEGMKVKCNLLLALSHRAEVLILDEPTSGLDPFSRDELLEIFLKLRDDAVAVFFSTHIISDIEKCADDIVYISGGRIVAAMPKDGFVKRYSQAGETLEETFLRLERGDGNA